MTECPSIDQLERALTAASDPALVAHVESCLACQGVLALVGDSDIKPGDDPVCALAELWLVARETGELAASDAQRLQEHLAQCAGCRDISV